MIKVRFYEKADDSRLKFAVIITKHWTYPEIQPRLIREMQRRENLEIPSK